MSSIGGGGGVSSSPPLPPKADQEEDASNIAALLDFVRGKITEGDKTNALAALLHAVRLTQGEDKIVEVIEVAKRNIAAMESHSEQEELEEARLALHHVLQGGSVLAEEGDAQILHDAFVDGSSVVCKKCSGLVARSRWDNHVEFWCVDAAGGEEEEDV